METYAPNKKWHRRLTKEEVFNKDFSIGYLIQTNQHVPMMVQLKELVLSDYSVTARFKYLGYNGENIEANGQNLVYRTDKFEDFKLNKHVEYISGNLSRRGGGSNNYPSVAYVGAECVLKFVSFGLPFVDSTNGWSIEIIELEKIS